MSCFMGGSCFGALSRLQSLGKEYELVIYCGDDHGLTNNLDDALRHAMAWFAAHAKM